MKNILFYCDSSEELGTGHVMRCVALAEVFSISGWKVMFAGNYDHPIWLSIYMKKFHFINIIGLDKISNIKNLDVVVVDSYCLKIEEYHEFFKNARLKVSIVDPITVIHEADLYFSNTPSRYFAGNYSKKKSYFGFQYSLVRREILSQKIDTNPSDKNSKIVLFTGGTTRSEVVNFFIKILTELNFYGQFLVFGNEFHFSKESLNFDLEFHDFDPTYPQYLKFHDLIFCPASSISIELLTLKYKIVVYKFINNQNSLYDALTENKFVRGIGDIGLNYLNDAAKIFQGILENPVHLDLELKNSIFDGMGAHRIFEIVSSHPKLR